jgi:hypothetical protein
MPEVFTIYNCGTSHNRQNLDETVADLARRTIGAENRDWMINDGPGSFSHRAGAGASAAERGLAAQANAPGTRDPITGIKESSWFGTLRTVLGGIVSGDGWEHNVLHTMAVFEATLDLPRTINMVGWSRGAITCFMIAHALHANPRTSGIDVNIFAFDPVPGPGNFDDPDKVSSRPTLNPMPPWCSRMSADASSNRCSSMPTACPVSRPGSITCLEATPPACSDRKPRWD